jgi:hypothetical protein
VAKGVSNFSNISNNDLVLLRRLAKKYSKVLVTAGTKKFTVEETHVSVISGGEGLSFISIPATNAIYRNGVLVSDPAEVKAAILDLRRSSGKSGRSGSKRLYKPEVPEELRKQLEAFAKENRGRIIADPNNPGMYKVQKTRSRSNQ